MSSQDPFGERISAHHDLNQTLYRYGLSLAVLFELLVAKGIVTPEEIRAQADRLSQELLCGSPGPHDN
ncbi:MAG: hypothetical protein OWU84_06710 [Firmicutes bacterium]|nr:hypothetical protein [Bacillota bacterium]